MTCVVWQSYLSLFLLCLRVELGVQPGHLGGGRGGGGGGVIKNFLNSKGNQNPQWFKSKSVLLNGWTWPIVGVESGRVCVCSLRSRLVKLQMCVIIQPKIKYNIPREARACSTNIYIHFLNQFFFFKLFILFTWHLEHF